MHCGARPVLHEALEPMQARKITLTTAKSVQPDRRRHLVTCAAAFRDAKRESRGGGGSGARRYERPNEQYVIDDGADRRDMRQQSADVPKASVSRYRAPRRGGGLQQAREWQSQQQQQQQQLQHDPYQQQQQQRGQQQHAKRRPRAPPPPPDPIPVLRGDGAAASTFFSGSGWAEVGANEEVAAALSSLGIRRPSHIQAAAYRALQASDARHVVLADHAGSGKTLAYLLPHLQLLKEEERFLGRAATQPRCPRLLVVVPTAELAAQATRVCRALSAAGLRFRSAAATGGNPMRTQRETLEGGVDVLVGTPGRLLELMEAGSLSLQFCRAVVLDEVDVLLSDALAFADQVRPLHAAAPESTRFVFASATIPEDLYLELEEEFPGLVAALGPGLHRTAPGVTQQLVDCSGGDEVSEETGFQRKAEALRAVLREQPTPRTIVFANKIETCRKLENYLNRGLDEAESVVVLPHHAAISDDRREANLRRFLAAPRAQDSARRSRRGGPDQAPERQQQQLVLVCTDRASRGLDSAFCEHVVLFDFPRDPSEYVRRVGRTARGGGSGTVTILVLGRQVKLAKDIIDRSEQGNPIHAVPAAMPVYSGSISVRSSSLPPLLSREQQMSETEVLDTE